MRVISFVVLCLGAVVAACALRGQDHVQEKLRKLQEVAVASREFGFGCQMDYLFNATKARRPNSAELDAIVKETEKFFLAKLSEQSSDFVGVTLKNLGLPLYLNDATYTLHFDARFRVKQESSWSSVNLYGILDGLDYKREYLENYVKAATPMSPLEKNIFYYTLDVNFRRATGHKKDNTFRDFESEGPYFESAEARKSPLREDTHVYNEKLWKQTVRNGGY